MQRNFDNFCKNSAAEIPKTYADFVYFPCFFRWPQMRNSVNFFNQNNNNNHQSYQNNNGNNDALFYSDNHCISILKFLTQIFKYDPRNLMPLLIATIYDQRSFASHLSLFERRQNYFIYSLSFYHSFSSRKLNIGGLLWFIVVIFVLV